MPCDRGDTRMKKIFLIIGLLLLTVVLLTSCGSDENDYEGMVKVTYELEGGTYQNSEEPVTLYYGFDAGTQNTIKTPTDFSNKKIERKGYTLVGWYTKKSGTGDGATYSNPWDFEKDKVTDAGLTLYAMWKKDINYTFELCYKDSQGKDVLLRSVVATAGQPVTSSFVTLAEKAMKTQHQLTPFGGWVDADGKAWDIEKDVHPGGETDTSIVLYRNYIDGVYSLVSTADELAQAVGGNIYLMNDIDFGGADFSGFGDYTGTILGNGHKISNFTLKYANGKDDIKPDVQLAPDGNSVLQVSLFKSLVGATLKDITFENYTVEVAYGVSFGGSVLVLVAPLTMKMEGATLEHVKVSATYTVGSLPDSLDRIDVKETAAAVYTPAEDTSVLTDVTVSITPAPVTE